MSHSEIWLVILAVGAVTFLWRFSFIACMGVIAEPPGLRRVLRFVPMSALSALVVSGLMIEAGGVHIDFQDPRYPASLLAALVAWRTRSLFWTIVTGMVALWVLRWLWSGV